jgi:hypothetical protein
MTGPDRRVSIITRWGRPSPKRDAELYAEMAVEVREESACACG